MKFWQEDQQDKDIVMVPDDVVDLNFRVTCRQLPLDHAHELSRAVLSKLPWMEHESQAAIHLIHVAESGNGWIRPQNPDDLIFPSRRTLFTLRLPKERVEAARQLNGATLKLGDYIIALSDPSVRPLSKITTLFSRYVIGEDVDDEDAFLNNIATELQQLDIHAKKMLCGKAHTLRFPQYDMRVRSVMVDGLDLRQSLRLQQQGLGQGLKVGCGIFLPHKGIDPVRDTQEK